MYLIMIRNMLKVNQYERPSYENTFPITNDTPCVHIFANSPRLSWAVIQSHLPRNITSLGVTGNAQMTAQEKFGLML